MSINLLSKSKSILKRDETYEFSKSDESSSRLKSIFLSSPEQIWKSKISWRIAITAFVSIMLVQAILLNFGEVDGYRQGQYKALAESARASIAAIIDNTQRSENSVPFSDKQIQRLLETSNINGLSVYSYQLDFIVAFGKSPHMQLSYDTTDKTYISPDTSEYEFILKNSDTFSTFNIVVQVDSSKVNEKVHAYVIHNIHIMVILSLMVTVVLMLAVGKWLLEPILFLRSNLIAAFKNPEAPNIQESKYNVSNEIGAAIDLGQKLIIQNAQNLQNLKSTAEDKIHKLAYYDPLTSLPNRTLFLQTLTDRSRPNNDESVERFAVITLDIDHFKDINDSMGHNVGDAILRSVGKKLRASLPESAAVSRTGEDEFAITMALTSDALTAKDVAERVISVIRAEPFKVFNEEFQVRASVGVSVFPDDSAEPDVVLKNADIALNRAKEEGRDTVKEYSEDFDRAVQERFQLLRDLRDALEGDQLDLHYQPQLCLKTGKVIGAEALLRWWKPDDSQAGGHFVSPGQFVPVAEQSGLIVPIGQWVLNKACGVAKECKEKHGIDIRFAVNVSGSQFVHGDICGDVSKVLEETGLDPKMIELEVTESVFMDDIQHTISILNTLNSLGVELAIDDFGTGYSSLSYLSQFPIDRLKIDQSFIRNALNDRDNASIARTIINLGHSLNLKVIAEGVETKHHESFLLNEGCDEVQGYRYSRPVPVDQFVEFVKSYNGSLDSFAD